MAIRYTLEERQQIAAAKAIVKAKARAKAAPVAKAARLAVEAVMMPNRRKLTPEEKAQVHAAHEGCCYDCGAPVPVTGPEVQYDHVLDRQFRGSEDLANFAPMHTVPCHARKTAQAATARGKADRRRKKHTGEIKPKGTIKSRSFDAGYQPLPQGRGFR